MSVINCAPPPHPPIPGQEQDVIVEAESSQSLSEGEVDGDGSEDDIRELRARRHALAHKLALQQKRQDKIQVRHVQVATSVHTGPGVPPSCFLEAKQ